MYRVITIGREFGSGGREIGKRLAEELGCAYYDKEIISSIAARSNLAEDYVDQVIEQPVRTPFPIFSSLSLSVPAEGSIYEINQSIFGAQSELLNELADKSDCVIVGRCADYVLAARKPFRIYVYAGMAHKIARCRERGDDGNGLSDKELEKRIRSIDKARADYYRFYTGSPHGDRMTYDIGINTSTVEIPDAVAAVAALVRAKK